METALNLLGLVLTAVGAAWAAWNIIIRPEQAKALSGNYYDDNKTLYEALLAQRRGARNGLWFVVDGTVMQVIALMLSVSGQAQETLSMALGSCQTDYMKNSKRIDESGFDGAKYLVECMHSKGFSVNYSGPCNDRAA